MELVTLESPAGLSETSALAIPTVVWLSCTVPVMEPVWSIVLTGVVIGAGASVGALLGNGCDGTAEARTGPASGIDVDDGEAPCRGGLSTSLLASSITRCDRGAS